MTKADLDLAHKTAGELAIYAKYVDQLGHAKLAACVRNASSLLQKLVEEAEAIAAATVPRDTQDAGMGLISRAPSDVWRNSVEHDAEAKDRELMRIVQGAANRDARRNSVEHDDGG